MKKIIAGCVLALMAGVTFAEATVDTAAEQTPPKKSLKRLMGGMVVRPGTMQGKIAVANAQTKVGTDVIDAAVADFRRLFNADVAVTVAAKPTVAGAKDAIAATGGNVALFLVEDPELPTVLDAPECGWTMVNVAPLAEGADEGTLLKRAKLEIVRGLALVAGAHSSSYPGSLMGAIKTPSDLDRLDPNASLPVDVASRFMNYLKSRGVTQGIKVQYRQAVKEGWAPAPTNDVQQAIWDKVHAIPKNPMKIEFDPKKGR